MAKTISTTSATKILKVSWKTVHNYLHRGLILGSKHPVSKRYLIDLDSVKKLQQQIEEARNKKIER